MNTPLFYKQQIFTAIFNLSNSFQVIGNEISEQITMRQWMTMMTIEYLPHGTASYNNIAKEMGCTKQNAKQLVGYLVKKDFVQLEKNTNDVRAINATERERGHSVMHSYYHKANEVLSSSFLNLTESDLKKLYHLLTKLVDQDTLGFEPNIFDSKKRGTKND